jgi:hypothetical protein
VAKSSGGPGINARARVHSRALFQPENVYLSAPTYLNPKPGAGGGGNADPGEAAGKMHKRGPERTAWGGDVQLGSPRTGSRERNNPQRGRPLQREGRRARGHAWRRECARSRVPGDSAPFRIVPPAPVIGPLHTAYLILFLKEHVRQVNCICGMMRADHRGGWHRHENCISRIFIEKAERCGITRHPAACAFASPCVPPRASPPAAAAGPAEGYFARANPSAVIPAAHPPPSGALGAAFVHFPAASPGSAFPPPPAPGLGFRYVGVFKYTFSGRNNARECTRARAFIPGPPLDLDIFFLAARAL